MLNILDAGQKHSGLLLTSRAHNGKKWARLAGGMSAATDDIWTTPSTTLGNQLKKFNAKGDKRRVILNTSCHGIGHCTSNCIPSGILGKRVIIVPWGCFTNSDGPSDRGRTILLWTNNIPRDNGPVRGC